MRERSRKNEPTSASGKGTASRTTRQMNASLSHPNDSLSIQVLDAPDDEWLAAMESDPAWGPVDRRARLEIARRRPPSPLVERAGRLADRLEAEFHAARCALDFTTPLELLVATILSAQCTDVRVNQVTPTLFRDYPAVESYAESSPGTLESAIRSTGFFNAKAKSIRACCRMLIEKHGGAPPVEMEALTALPGVGRKTAAVLRANAFGLPGIPVDTHVQRIARRLGLTVEEDPAKIEFDLGSLLPPARWSQFSHAVVLHGRKTCKARRPSCATCALQNECPSAFAFDL